VIGDVLAASRGIFFAILINPACQQRLMASGIRRFNAFVLLVSGKTFLIRSRLLCKAQQSFRPFQLL
jgi:hypothetical protein